METECEGDALLLPVTSSPLDVRVAVLGRRNDGTVCESGVEWIFRTESRSALAQAEHVCCVMAEDGWLFDVDVGEVIMKPEDASQRRRRPRRSLLIR